jgi:hypothetical protein
MAAPTLNANTACNQRFIVPKYFSLPHISKAGFKEMDWNDTENTIKRYYIDAHTTPWTQRILVVSDHPSNLCLMQG